MYTFCISYRRRKPIRQLNSTIELKNSYVYIIGDVFAWCPIAKLSLLCIVLASPGQWWEAKGEARGFPSLARGGRNYTPKAKFSDRTPSKHVSNNIHIWILQFNCRVQLSYRFTMPIRDTKRIDKKLKKSYVYTLTSQCLNIYWSTNWPWLELTKDWDLGY